MPEETRNENLESKPEDLNRRQFFIKMGATSLAVAGAGACVLGLQYLTPSVLYEPSPVVDAGKPEQYSLDSVTLDPRFGVFIVRLAQGFYAMSAVCTHLGCLSAWKQDAGIIACPCHGSAFARDGKVLDGPAPRPLPWLKMWINDEGSLMVDRSTAVPAESEYVRA